MIRNNRPDTEAMVLAACTPFLKSNERAALLAAAPSHRDLLRLSGFDVERIIGRALVTARWQPELSLPCIERSVAWLDHPENNVLWIGDDDYPATLRETYDPPSVLFARGTPRRRWDSSFAVVGTRKPTNSALDAAFDLGFSLGLQERPVVSGLALGIDAAAHRGAVRAAGPCIGVLGNGIDSVYPARHRGLAADILDLEGLLLSEYPPGTATHRYHFPARNRIITGLAPTLCVVQAPERSGALISVDFALEQGRDVWVHIEGTGESEESAGTRSLVAQGAPTFYTVADLGLSGSAPRRRKRRLADPRMALFGTVASNARDPRRALVAAAREKMAQGGRTR